MHSAEFVAAMEDVLDLYEEPYDPQRPTVCFDETPLSSLGRVAYLSQPGRDGESGSTMSTGATAPVICSCSASHCGVGLNTHRPASLYETFDPAEARRILKRLEFHYTPKHGSWLNMAEIELSVFSRQCLTNRSSA